MLRYSNQVQQYLSLSDQTLHLAVANFDLVLYQVDFEVEEVQLLGLVSLLLAAKVEEDVPPGPDLLLPLTGGVFTKADLARVEKEAVKTLNWKLRKTTAVVFLHYYSEIIGRSGRVVFKLARAILDLCLEQVEARDFSHIFKFLDASGGLVANFEIFPKEKKVINFFRGLFKSSIFLPQLLIWKY